MALLEQKWMLVSWIVGIKLSSLHPMQEKNYRQLEGEEKSSVTEKDHRVRVVL